MKRILVLWMTVMCMLMTACGTTEIENSQNPNAEVQQTENEQETGNKTESSDQINALADIPAYSGSPFVVINGNEPSFSDEEKDMDAFEYYGDLDEEGRCGAVEAKISEDLMPTEKRGQIGQVRPTGWHTVKYDNVDGKYLYNRCHLIGYQLTAENANEKNLITGTRYMNVEGMLPFENMVADYIKETGNHVLYRVNPVFAGDNMLAYGVQMEAQSVEDDGEGIMFNVFVYNVQPGIEIDYTTGESRVVGTDSGETGDSKQESTYVLNKNTKKFHVPSCSSAKDITEENKEIYKGSREDLVSQGYEPCGRCHP